MGMWYGTGVLFLDLGKEGLGKAEHFLAGDGQTDTGKEVHGGRTMTPGSQDIVTPLMNTATPPNGISPQIPLHIQTVLAEISLAMMIHGEIE